MVNSQPIALFLIVNSHPIALFLMVDSHPIAPFLMVNSHPIALSYGELSPQRSFSWETLTTSLCFSSSLMFFFFCVTQTVCKLDGTKVQPTVVKRAPTFPLITDTWHRNNCIKQGIKSLRPSVTENAVQRLSHTKSPHIVPSLCQH